MEEKRILEIVSVCDETTINIGIVFDDKSFGCLILSKDQAIKLQDSLDDSLLAFDHVDLKYSNRMTAIKRIGEALGINKRIGEALGIKIPDELSPIEKFPDELSPIEELAEVIMEEDV